jgi:ATP-dependent protease Clp ATPase subunit
VPFSMADATTLTKASYVGENVMAAGGNRNPRA